MSDEQELDEYVEVLRAGLAKDGFVKATGPDGQRLWLVLSTMLEEPPGLLIAYEGVGAMFWELDRPLNEFRLVQHGFSIRIAPALADTLNRVMGELRP